jgi:hypothetical protein
LPKLSKDPNLPQIQQSLATKNDTCEFGLQIPSYWHFPFHPYISPEEAPFHLIEESDASDKIVNLARQVPEESRYYSIARLSN